MRLFLDTNIFIAAVTDEPETESVAVELLDSDHEFLKSCRKDGVISSSQPTETAFPLD